MKRSRIVLASAAVAVAVVAGAASGHGISGRTVALEAAVQSGIMGAGDAPADLKALQKAAKLLDKESNEKSLAAEIGSAAKAAKATSSLTIAGAAAVQTAFADASNAYQNDVGVARAALQLNADALGLSKKAKKKLTGALGKVAAQLDALMGAPDVAARLSIEAKAAAAAKGYTPYDDGNAYVWVISSVQLAGADQGLDLDDDDTGDNALAQLVAAASGLGVPIDVNGTLAASLAASPNVGLIEMWGVDQFQKDPLAFAGLFAGADTDASTADNFSGMESFTVVNGTLGADGHAVVRAATSLKKGAYRFELTGQTLALAGITLPANGIVVVQGNVTGTSNTGRIGAAIPTATLLEVLADAGIDLGAFAAQIATFADLDLDGNGSNDAFSAAFTFATVNASVQQDQ